jgi:hypothetical protein
MSVRENFELVECRLPQREADAELAMENGFRYWARDGTAQRALYPEVNRRCSPLRLDFTAVLLHHAQACKSTLKLL